MSYLSIFHFRSRCAVRCYIQSSEVVMLVHMTTYMHACTHIIMTHCVCSYAVIYGHILLADAASLCYLRLLRFLHWYMLRRPFTLSVSTFTFWTGWALVDEPVA